VNFVWERLADGVFRCRLPFLDVTVGLVYGRAGAMLIDTGTTLTEARAIAEDVQDIANREVSHIVLTHNHFDHILGSSAFDGAEIYCAAEVATTMAERTDHLRADAVRYGADAAEVDRAIAALCAPEHRVTSAVVDLGSERPVVFCGDLVEESGDPAIDADSDPVAWPATLERVIEGGGEDAVFVPGHGAVVDAAFVRTQRDWWRTQM
jgi:glyoxylase-like metal-dependent hydrolase (beta-lactamase superfamily II)